MKQIFLTVATLLAINVLSAQDLNPVTWTFEAKNNNDGTADLMFIAAVDKDWYVYSQFVGDDGPIPTSFSFDENNRMGLIGKATEDGTVKKEGFDQMFEMNLKKFGGTVTFVQKIKFSSDLDSISGELEYMTCDDTRCLPPRAIPFKFNLK